MFKNNTSDLNIKYLKLEITNCLMEIEHRKMDFLKSQLHSPKLSDLLKLRMSNEIFFIERKIQKLQHEYQKIGLEFIEVNRINYLNKQNCKNQIQFINANLKKNSRSQPAIGIKQTSKARPTIFPIIESYLRCRSPSSDNSDDSTNRSSGSSSGDSPDCIDRLNDVLNNSSSRDCSISSTPTTASGPVDDLNDNSVHLLSSSVDSGTASDNGGGGGHLYENVHISPAKDFTFKDTTMTSCDLETLLQHLLPSAQHTPDHSYTFTFLLCSRLFLRPDQLFEQIFFANFLDRANGSGGGGGSGGQKLYKNFIENLLYEWITVFPYDFIDERLMALFVDFAQKAHSVLEKNFTKNLRKYMDRKLNLSLLYDSYLKSLLPDESATNANGDRGANEETEAVSTCPTTENAPAEEQNPVQQKRKTTRTLEECIFQRRSGGISSATDDSKGDRIMFLLDIFSKERSQESAKRTLSDLRRLANDSDIMDLCSDPRILAQQLTLIEFERLSFIGPQEFVQTFVKEQQKHKKTVFADKSNSGTEDTKKETQKPKCLRNVDNYVAWFNRLSNLVAAEIVCQAKQKNRTKMTEFWIEVAAECFELRNLNSLMSIIAGLNLAPISRLKKMWSKVSTMSKFEWLEQQMDPSNNFSNYRTLLKSSLCRASSSAYDRKLDAQSSQFCNSEKLQHQQQQPPQQLDESKRQLMIPFFSLLVKDLYFLNEGCANRLPNGHINFEKCWQFSKQITEFLVWKEYQCTFEKVHAVIFYLETKRTCRDENELALNSFQCEPPENLMEKGRLRLLKKSP